MEVGDSQKVELSADTTQWQLQDLEKDRLYRVHLSACTRAGCGPPMAEECRTASIEGG